MGLPINVESRSLFSERIAKHCEGDRAVADKVPTAALVKAVLAVKGREDAEKFFGGQMHWLRGKYPRTMQDAFEAATANVRYCFDEGMKPAAQKMWEGIIEENREAAEKLLDDSTAAFKKASAIGEQIKSGKDPALMASLAKKALLKKGPTP